LENELPTWSAAPCSALPTSEQPEPKLSLS
jgi:hypothetical protein